MQAVTLYTTGICPYCVQAKQLLVARGVTQLTEIRVDLDPARHHEMVARTQRRTVPQIFIGSTHIGGCDDLMALDSQGELMPLLQLT